MIPSASLLALAALLSSVGATHPQDLYTAAPPHDVDDAARDALLVAKPGSPSDVLYRYCRDKCVSDPAAAHTDNSPSNSAQALPHSEHSSSSASSSSPSTGDAGQEVVILDKGDADDAKHAQPVQHTTLVTAVRPAETVTAPAATETETETDRPARPFFLKASSSPNAPITPFDYCVLNCFGGFGHLDKAHKPALPVDDYAARLDDCHQACLDRLPSPRPPRPPPPPPSEKTAANVTVGDSETDSQVDADADVDVDSEVAAPKEPLPTDFAPTTALSEFDVCVFYCVYHSDGTPPVLRFIYPHFMRYCYDKCEPKPAPSSPDSLLAPNPRPPTADDVIRLLGLVPNAERGYYVETFRDPTNVHFRPSSCPAAAAAAATDPEGKLVVSNDIFSIIESSRTTTATANKGYSASTAIYYLLRAGDGVSFWHAVDAPEVWHFYAGSPLDLELSWNRKGESPEQNVLGNDLFKGQRPQIVIGAGQWQRARTTGDWTLVGTTVAPGFDFMHGYEVQRDPDWKPDGSHPNATFDRYTVLPESIEAGMILE